MANVDVTEAFYRQESQPTRHLNGMQNDGRALALRALLIVSQLIAAGIDTQRV